MKKIDKEILKSKELSLPIFYTDKPCEKEIYDRITAFYNLLSSYDGMGSVGLNSILEFQNHLDSMFKDYYLGHLSYAYIDFIGALSYILSEIPTIKVPVPYEPLYRARINANNCDYKNNEMFHIKYSERSKVGTQRFSVPGLPCLYLGASAYVCWLELNRPGFDRFQIASLIPDNSLNKSVLDLSIHPLTFYRELERRENGEKVEHEELSLEKYLLYWPVIAACSMAVKNEGDSFKPEYIFPQFLLQLILEKKLISLQEIDGIKYMSIKAGRVSKHQYESDYRTYTNYVFPTKSVMPNNDDFCEELCAYFKISNNLSGKELQILSDLIREKGINWKTEEDTEEIANSLDEAVIYSSNDRAYMYKDSIFRRIEKILENADLEDGTGVFKPISIDDINRLFI